MSKISVIIAYIMLSFLNTAEGYHNYSRSHQFNYVQGVHQEVPDTHNEWGSARCYLPMT